MATNKHAGIRSRVTKNGKLRTETHRRDDGAINMAISTHEKTDNTVMFIDVPDEGSIRLSGREARTLFRLLSRHYEYVGK